MSQLRPYLPAILSLVIAAVGWFYLFYSRAAQRLAGIESEPANRRRIRLRRANGLLVAAMGLMLCALAWPRDWDTSKGVFLLLMALVSLALPVVLILVAIDMRYTHRLRRQRKDLLR